MIEYILLGPSIPLWDSDPDRVHNPDGKVLTRELRAEIRGSYRQALIREL